MRIDQLSAGYGKKEFLHSLSFSLPRGALTLLLGKNGSGKSTLLHALAGQLPHRGSITLQDQPIDSLSPRERAKKIALLPQNLPSSRLTPLELAFLGRNPHTPLAGRLSEADCAKAEEALRRADLWELRFSPLEALSGGERQRAYLAMVLAQDAEILLLDEPTAHLDPAAARAFMERLCGLAAEGKTILAAIHDLNTAAAFGQNLILLDQGSLFYCGDARSALEQQKIAKLFDLEQATDGQRYFFY